MEVEVSDDGLLQQMWYPKPWYCYYMLQLRCTFVHSRWAIQRKRAWTLQAGGKRVLRSPKRRNYSQHSVWCNNSPRRLSLIPANNIQHKRKLLALHSDNHWNTGCGWCTLPAPQILAFIHAFAAFTINANSLVVPIRNQYPRQQQEKNQAKNIKI